MSQAAREEIPIYSWPPMLMPECGRCHVASEVAQDRLVNVSLHLFKMMRKNDTHNRIKLLIKT